MRVELRTMSRADLPMLAGWLRDPLVETWWHDDPAEVEQRYGPSLDGDDPTVLRIGEEDGAPVGFIQWFRFADEPDYRAEVAAVLPVPSDAMSMDYLIGPAARGRGAGRALIAAALAAIGPVPLIVPVHAANAASIGALRANGFTIAASGELEPDNPVHSREHVFLVR